MVIASNQSYRAKLRFQNNKGPASLPLRQPQQHHAPSVQKARSTATGHHIAKGLATLSNVANPEQQPHAEACRCRP
jgi:hypothetical protein